MASCLAYVEVRHKTTGQQGWGWGRWPECNDDSCLRALNIAAYYACTNAGASSAEDCEATYWRYGCQDNFDDVPHELLSKPVFTDLPSEQGKKSGDFP